MDVQRDQNEPILVLLNHLYFLYNHVTNALDCLDVYSTNIENNAKMAWDYGRYPVGE